MDERIKITTRKMSDDTYESIVSVNGETYARVRGPEEAYTVSEAQHYAMQIEIDEWGNW